MGEVMDEALQQQLNDMLDEYEAKRGREIIVLRELICDLMIVFERAHGRLEQNKELDRE